MEELVIGSIVVCVTILLWRYFRPKPEDGKGQKGQHKTRDNSVAIHDILQDKNGNGVADKGFPNPTYIKDDDVFVQSNTSSTAAATEEFGRPRQTRQISDISELFRPPYGDDKSLSELVFEELDRAKSTESLDVLSRDRPDVTSAVEHDGKSGEPPNRDSDCNENNDTAVDCDVIEARQTEWREKLKQDLADDDEEFMEEITDDDLDDVSDDTTSESDVDNKMRGDVNNVGRTPVPAQTPSLGRPLVVDNGSYKVRFGWAGDFEPVAIDRNVFGHWRAETSEAWKESLGSKFVGDAAISKHNTLALSSPVQDGRVADWHEMQDVWNHVISTELETEVTQQPMIVTESANVTSKQRERMLEVLIETLRVPAVSLRNQSVLCALSADRKVAVVVSSGHGVTEVVPVYEGYQITSATQILPVGGRHLTDMLARIVQREKGETFTSVSEMEIINSIKERYASVPKDSSVTSQPSEQEILLPDGKVITLDKELSSCVEPLFSPTNVGSTCPGLPQIIKQAVERVDPDLMTYGDNTILLAGGNSMLNGLKPRVQQDVSDLVGGLNVQSAECSENASWIGASLLAQQSNFTSQCVNEDLYFEHGAKIVHRMCF
uniref:Actin n=1 Tax=Phallusia mammillata TaxID=59560 RepID=A0A6F9D576_9ASCI|nr:actin [Phallusia mammillata]